MTAATPSITELLEICDRMSRRSEALFVALGSWVPTTSEPVQQQLFAEASHRHAWHRHLWDERRPTIGDERVGGGPPPPNEIEQAERLSWYRSTLGELVDDVTTLANRVDRVLDPSTARVLDLVGTDLAALAHRIDG